MDINFAEMGGTALPPDSPPPDTVEVTAVHMPPGRVEPLPAISPLDEMKTILAQYDAPLAEMTAQAQALEVKDDKSHAQATGMASEAKKLAKALDGDRKALTDPLTKMAKSIKALADNYLDKLSAIDLGLRQKIKARLDAQEMARREAEKTAREAAAKAQAEINARAEAANVEPVTIEVPVVPAQETKTRTEAGTSYVKSIWKFEITDAAQVPRQYLVVSDQLVRQAVQAGAREIPGVRIYEDKTVQIRTT